jgi:chromosome segregation ATPase
MEEKSKRKELEDRIKNIQSSKEDLISENAKMNSKITDLQQKMANQALEIETLKRNNDSVRNVIFEYYFKMYSALIHSSLNFKIAITRKGYRTYPNK